MNENQLLPEEKLSAFIYLIYVIIEAREGDVDYDNILEDCYDPIDIVTIKRAFNLRKYLVKGILPKRTHKFHIPKIKTLNILSRLVPGNINSFNDFIGRNGEDSEEHCKNIEKVCKPIVAYIFRSRPYKLMVLDLYLDRLVAFKKEIMESSDEYFKVLLERYKIKIPYDVDYDKFKVVLVNQLNICINQLKKKKKLIVFLSGLFGVIVYWFTFTPDYSDLREFILDAFDIYSDDDHFNKQYEEVEEQENLKEEKNI